MLEMMKYKNLNNYDALRIITERGFFEISFEGVLDLFWLYRPTTSILDCEPIQKFIISKEDYFIFSAFNDLFNAIKNNKPHANVCEDHKYKNEKIKYCDSSNKLFENGKIDWHSDDYEYEYASSITIEKINNDEFEVIFKKSSSDNVFSPLTFAVRFRNSGSRYDPFNFTFMHMYNKLLQYDFGCHQIHIEEELYKNGKAKKLVKKQ